MMRTALGGLIALAAAVGIGRFVYTPILPPMIEALGLSQSEAGLIASANFLGYLLGALLTAWRTPPGSRHAWLVVSLAVSAITTGGMSLARSMLAFLLLRFIGGGASAVVLVLASAIVLERLAVARRSKLSSLHFAGVGAGITVSAALVAGLVHAGQDWRDLWLASGAVSLAATAIVAVLLRGDAASSARTAERSRGAANPALLRLIVAYGLFGFGYVITATFLVAIVRGAPSLCAFEPLIWIVFGVAAVPSVMFWTSIADRTGIPKAFALACVVEAVGVLASVAWPTGIGIFLASILVGGTFMGLTALGLVRARVLSEGDPRRVLALMTGAFGLGQIIGPAFAGVVSDRLGSFTAPSVTAMVVLFVAGALALMPGNAADNPVAPR